MQLVDGMDCGASQVHPDDTCPVMRTIVHVFYTVVPSVFSQVDMFHTIAACVGYHFIYVYLYSTWLY